MSSNCPPTIINTLNYVDHCNKYVLTISALTLKDFTEVEMKFEEKEERLQEKLESVNNRFQCLENVAGQGSQINAEKIEHLSDSFLSIQSRFEEITNVMDNVLERLHEFELQRKNNLLFYGVPEDPNESSVKLLGKIREIVRSQFGLQVNIINYGGTS